MEEASTNMGIFISSAAALMLYILPTCEAAEVIKALSKKFLGQQVPAEMSKRADRVFRFICEENADFPGWDAYITGMEG